MPVVRTRLAQALVLNAAAHVIHTCFLLPSSSSQGKNVCAKLLPANCMVAAILIVTASLGSRHLRSCSYQP